MMVPNIGTTLPHPLARLLPLVTPLPRSQAHLHLLLPVSTGARAEWSRVRGVLLDDASPILPPRYRPAIFPLNMVPSQHLRNPSYLLVVGELRDPPHTQTPLIVPHYLVTPHLTPLSPPPHRYIMSGTVDYGKPSVSSPDGNRTANATIDWAIDGFNDYGTGYSDVGIINHHSPQLHSIPTHPAHCSSSRATWVPV